MVEHMTAYSNILVAVDLSPEAKAVVGRACELGKSYGAVLCLIHVVEPILLGGDYELAPAMPVELEDTLLQRAKGYLESLAEEDHLDDSGDD